MEDEKVEVLFVENGVSLYDNEVDDIDEDYKPYTLDELKMIKNDWEKIFANTDHPYEDDIYMDINGTVICVSKKSCIEEIDKIIKQME
jgi:hypothetical protein